MFFTFPYKFTKGGLKMLIWEKILKVGRLLDQTGGSEGFYEPDFDKHQHNRNTLSQDGKIKLNLQFKELKSGDVVIQKKV